MSTPSTPSKQNLTVAMNDILFNPTDVTSLTLRCDGSYRGRLESLTIRKQFKDGFEPIAVAIFNDSNFVEVVKLYPNITHLVDVTSDSVTLSLNLDPFRCIDLTNYTCSVVDEEDVARAEAPISVFLPEPLLGVPHAVVEARELTLQCLAEIWHQNGDVVWKFKPPQATRFMLFSVPPVTTVKYNNCTTVVNSTLTFNVTSFEHDAEFRCEIVPRWPDPQVIQTRFSDVTLKVVPGNYCEGKRPNTIYPHPHGPCTLVVYCLSTGPLVFEIECEPNHCYDYVKTACVLRDTG
ncbi:uncharacterized protein LOC127879734 [Dreissena polymorpha]|nr:uncharacterized protein LOC127879734 [Dreissena polymorpha]